MTHYMIYGEINKQAGEIQRIRSELNHNMHHSNLQVSELHPEQIRSIVREETNRVNTERSHSRQNSKLHRKSNLNPHSRKEFLSATSKKYTSP